MTSREVYYKIYATSELPIAMAWFTTRDKNSIIQLGSCVWLCFADGHEVNIKKMEKIAKQKGFMFWNYSEEGLKFFETNGKEIAKLMANLILNQK